MLHRKLIAIALARSLHGYAFKFRPIAVSTAQTFTTFVNTWEDTAVISMLDKDLQQQSPFDSGPVVNILQHCTFLMVTLANSYNASQMKMWSNMALKERRTSHIIIAKESNFDTGYMTEVSL